MLRIGIVGCGKIADQHLVAISRIPDCAVVAVCDREIRMAQQLGERFGIPAVFADCGEMLLSASPDVVHVTTPPQSHFPLARQCLEAGRHVYLEKPFTLTAAEAQDLIAIAEERDVGITPGHNYQFTMEMIEMRKLVRGGFLGGEPVHLESHFAYSLDDRSYVGPILGSRNHWVRKLPGQLFHNVISHGIAKLAEFLDDDLDEIIATGHQSAELRDLNGQEVLDELRVLIRDRKGTTAFFCFSTQIKPGLHQFRICGPKNSIQLDHASGSLLKLRSRSCKSYLTYFLPPVFSAREHLSNACSNVKRFLGRELYQDFGMKELIERFYQSVKTRAPLPISYREVLLTARIMDAIFEQVYRQESSSHRTSAVLSLA